MTNRTVVVAALVLGACRTDCEPKVHNVDHDLQTEAEVLQAHDLLQELLDPRYEVCLRRIELNSQDRDPEISGWYRHYRKKMKFINGSAEFVTWHEMGHALFAQNPLEEPERYEPGPGVRPEANRRHRESETFARSMEYALTFSHLLGERCPDDRPETDQLMGALGYVTGFDEDRIFEGPAWDEVGGVVAEEGALYRDPEGGWWWGGDDAVAALTLSTGELSAPTVHSAGLEVEEPGGLAVLSEDAKVYPFVINGSGGPFAETAVRWALAVGPIGSLRLAGLGCVEPLDHVVVQEGQAYRVRWLDGELEVAHLVGFEG